MRPKILPAITLLLIAFTFGALLGRRWQGDLADIFLGSVATLAVAAMTLALFNLWWEREGLSITAGISLWFAVRQAITERPWRAVAFVGAWLLAGLVLWLLPDMLPDANYAGVVILWLLSFGLYVLAIAPLRILRVERVGQPQRFRRFHSHRRVTIALIGITLAAALFRLTQIGSNPYVLAGDEATFGMQSLRVIRGEIGNPFAIGSLGQPTMSFFFGGLAVRLLGLTQQAIRIPWAIVGVLTVPVTFWLVARLRNERLGLLAAGLLAVYHFHIHYSRLSLNNIADPLLAGLAVLLMYRAMDRRSALDWALAGAVCGASLYSYQGARFTPVLFMAIIVYLTWYECRFWQKHGWGIAIALGAFLIVGAPMLQFASRFPDEFNGRVDSMGILQSGWLVEATQQGRDLLAVLFDQFTHAALAFNLYSDRTVWYGLPGPLLDPIFGGLFLLGLGYGTVRAFRTGGDRQVFPMVAWWWGAMILGGMLTENPPSTMRLVTLTLPVCFFIALALEQLVRLAQRAFENVPARALLAAGGLLFSILSLKTYFVDYSPLHIGGGPGAELATKVGTMLQTRALPDKIYFFGAPFLYWDFPTFAFFLPQAKAADVIAPITSPPPEEWIPAGQGGVFIFSSGRRAELPLVQMTFPKGEIIEERTARGDQVLVTVYQVSP